VLDLSAETPTLNFGLLPGIAHMLAIEGVLIKGPEGAKTEHRYQYEGTHRLIFGLSTPASPAVGPSTFSYRKSIILNWRL
jgi:hypothetical protein